MKPADAAAITDPAQLPEHLRAPAAQLLAAYGRALRAKGFDAEQIARDVTYLLQRIAFAEPEVCPTLTDAFDQFWPPMQNWKRRAFMRGLGSRYKDTPLYEATRRKGEAAARRPAETED